MEILHAYGVPDETINAINILYTNTMAQVLTRDGISIATTDTDFADDIALLSNTLKQAEGLLQKTQKAARQIGLHINGSKTEFMSFNITNPCLKTDNSKALKHANDFIYIG